MTTRTRKPIRKAKGNDRSMRRVVFVAHKRKTLGSLSNAETCASLRACVRLLQEASDAIWVCMNSSLLFAALEKCLPRVQLDQLLLLDSPLDRSRETLLRGLFRGVTGDDPSLRFLPDEEMCEVLTAPGGETRDMFIGGVVDRDAEAAVLIRGDLAKLVVPLSIFTPTGETSPDFDALEFTDHGQTVKFGDYEASADAILYERDPDYRRRLNSRRRAEEKGFGPALRRLRKQLGVKREDFGVAAATIARIERGERKPQSKTLKAIEKRMGMSSDEIETY